MFFSSYEGGLDAKGRVSVPASFRAALGSESKVYVYPAVDGSGCLEGGGEALMSHNRAIISRMSPGDPVYRGYRHSFFTRSAELALDANGRITLPRHLIEHAGITDRVIFAGADDRFQIWEPARFAAHDAQMAEIAAANQDKLAQPFFDALAAGDIRPGGAR